MPLAIFEDDIVDMARKHKGHIITRRQHCRCHKTLALEITDKLGARGEYWVAKGAIHYPFETELLYEQEVWFGNFIRCPNCGHEGKLPMDKPLNAEDMEKTEEAFNAKRKEISGT